jgi:hypothetical protein
MKKNYWWILGIFVWAPLVLYAFFSYSLTAPNLILSSWEPYWEWQLWMWKTFYNNRQLLTHTYLGLISLIWLAYFAFLWQLRQNKTPLPNSWKQWLVALLLAISPLLVANNALSYDVFNYMFNAKMVLLYQADPHQKVALDFSEDDWLKFMHNVHTPAPYGYGWTAISLLPSWLGQQKLAVTWLLFRSWSVMSWLALAGVYWWHARQTELENRDAVNWWSWAVILNPLLTLEIISNSHNDLWMMVPALVALLLASRPKTKLATLLLTGLLLAFSISIKWASLVLLPIWLLLILNKFTQFPKILKKYLKYWPVVAALCMFVPLFTARSQQFHPWYLSWVVVWLPLFPFERKSKLSTVLSAVAASIGVLAVSSLFRYVPFLYNNRYTDQILLQQKSITWAPWVVASILLLIWATIKVWRKK